MNRGCQQQEETEGVSVSWQQAIITTGIRGSQCDFNPINPNHGHSSANPLWAPIACHPIPSYRIASTGYSISSHPSPPISQRSSLSLPLPRCCPAQCTCLIARSIPFNPSYPISPPTSHGTPRQLEVSLLLSKCSILFGCRLSQRLFVRSSPFAGAYLCTPSTLGW
ncbi:hypothetical protein CGRA01v4_09140 [Colletotrichum graminicola]|nr:hypothetical protein CGRA01v4_09140 [Colletotrichum graminicola]